LLITACGKSQSGQDPAQADKAAVDGATSVESTPEADDQTDLIAILRPTEGNTANGIVAFIQQEDGVMIRGELFGLKPGKHGFHIHTVGDCSAPDASSAGGHYSSIDSPHGSPDNMKEMRHTGDLGNVSVGADGSATFERLDTVIELGGANSIRGRALILHGGEDDLTSQPSGAAGPRVACGVIG
jgi:Cu-Zn family superoxide dismutase